MNHRALLMSALIGVAAPVALAEETRELGAHLHGSGTMNIAIEGRSVAIEFEAPGADIVGFEYAAESVEDRARVDAAIADLASALNSPATPAFLFAPTTHGHMSYQENFVQVTIWGNNSTRQSLGFFPFR